MSNPSIWHATARPAGFPSLTEDLAVDVAVVGGGITGIMTAALLCAAGKSVAVLEAHLVASGSTGYSTGNLYAPVGAGLAGIEDKWDEAAMRRVAASRLAAVERIEALAARHGIECGFRRVPFHLFGVEGSDEEREQLERELDAARRCGLAARIEPRAPLPFATARTLVIDGQAQFHPFDFVRGLARRIEAPQCRIFENTAALEIDADEGLVRTAVATVRAREIVMATHTPKGFNLVQTELGPYREYAVAGPLDSGELPGGVFWSAEARRHSVRSMSHAGRTYAMVIGAKHKVGQEPDPQDCYAELERYLRERLAVGAISHRWSAQGYWPADALPYIGRSAGAGHLYIATGFSADGLTYGALAAHLVSDLILGRADEALAELYQPTRLEPVKAAKDFVKENLNVAGEYLKDYAKLLAAPEVEELAPGDGMVVQLEGRRCAVHRTASGELLAVSPVCTHLKCIVHWNRAEQSWDCPCHGSRFQPDGSVIEGPAAAPLDRLRG